MGNQVYANGREVSCKAADGKSICAFPDVCFTPPLTPATPPGVPIPYPNTGLATDATSGSSTVKISGQEVMLKNKSYFKKSMGDEAGNAPKKGVLTSKNMGKVYFTAWSMDVKVESENVVRFADLTMHNHGSCPANTPPTVYIDEAAVGLAQFDKCSDEKKAVNDECVDKPGDPCPGKLSSSGARSAAGNLKSAAEAAAQAEKSKCAQAVKCFLRPYRSKSKNTCCNGQTGHHIPPWSTTETALSSTTKVTKKSALCVCLEGTNHSIGSHGKHHHGINYLLKKLSAGTKAIFTPSKVGDKQLYSAKLSEHIKVSAAVTKAQLPCSQECIEQQLNSQFEAKELDNTATHNASSTGGESYGQLGKEETDKLDNAVNVINRTTWSGA
jgi:hypothetical protein